MCGLLFTTRKVSGKAFENALNLMTHRGPDDSDVVSLDGFLFGHRRLSILDLSQSGRQPMFSFDRSIICVFNGEIYNYEEIRYNLKSKGVVFRSTSDTEVLIAAYQYYGKGFLATLIGMFSFVLYDINNKSIFAARDRLGVKPLFYSRVGLEVSFASEVKALVALEGGVPDIDVASISSFLSFRYPLIEKSFVKGVAQVPPGYCIEMSANRDFILSKYWDIDEKIFQQSEDLGEDYYLAKFQELLASSVKYRMISDVPVGAYLSGGVDSSAVVAEMSRLSEKPVKTFTVGFENSDYNEFEYAKEVASLYGTEHQEILLTPKCYLKNMSEVIKLKDAPLGVPNEVPLFLMSKELKKSVTVVLSGEGADEIFGGYGRLFRSADDFVKLSSSPHSSSEDFKRKYQGCTFSDQVSHFLHLYRYTPPSLKRLVLAKEIDIDKLDYELEAPFRALFERLGNVPYRTKMMYVFEKLHLPGLLQRVDATTMGASVEARVPFTDHRIVEFSFSLPDKYKLKWKSELHKRKADFLCGDTSSECCDIPKYLLKKSMERKLPASILHRRKMGFPVPITELIEEIGLADLQERLIYGRICSSGIFDREGIRKLFGDEKVEGRQGFPMLAWMLLGLEIYMETLYQ